MEDILIQPKHFSVNDAKRTSLTLYDHRVSEITPNQEFQLLLNGRKLCTCTTKDGFLLIIHLPLGNYLVSLRLGRGSRSELKTLVKIDRPGEYSLRVLTAPTFLGFGELRYHPE